MTRTPSHSEGTLARPPRFLQDVKPEWQTAAANLLVTLGGTYGKEVLEYLVKRVEPGVMPHYFVVKTLGDLAVANRTCARSALSPDHSPGFLMPVRGLKPRAIAALAVVPTLKELFGRLVALFGLIKHDNQRWVFSTSTSTAPCTHVPSVACTS